MTKSLSLLLTILFFQLSSAQVGIGTANPSASAALEIKSTNSGLLIPRVSLISTSDLTTITSPEISLMVYNLSSSNDVTPGFYYWDGSWKTLKGSSTTSTSSVWNITGNALSTGTEYIGTNNYNPLFFKVNNNPFAKFDPHGGITMGIGAEAKDDNSVAIGTSAKAITANQATAVGPSAVASGYQSTALGYASTASNNSTIALGISSNASGYQSIALGLSSVSNTNNTLAIGNLSQATGQQSTALGYQANSSGQNATAIGYQSTATQANSVILGNSTDANSKIGIGTNTPSEKLHVVGSVRIVDGTQANNYVLTSDNSGKGTWQNPNANKAYAEISANNNMPLQTGDVTFNTAGQSANMNAVTTTGIKIKTPGIYRITYSLSLYRDNVVDTVTSNFSFFLYNGQNEMGQTRVYGTATNGINANVSFTKLVYLNTDQTVSVRSDTTNPNINILANSANLVVELVK